MYEDEGSNDFAGVESDLDADFMNGEVIPDIDEAIISLTDEEKDALRLEVRSVVKKIDHSIMDLGGLLYRVFASKSFEKYGWETFPEYCEHEVGRKERYCRYLMSIWYGLTYKITDQEHKDAVLDLGFSKAARLIPHLNDANVEEVLKDIDGLTVTEVEDYIKVKKGKKEPVESDEEVRKFSVDLLQTQLENLQLGLRVARDITGSVSVGHGLDLMATEFIAGHSEAGTAKAELVRAHVRALQDLTGSDYAPSIDIPMLEGMMQKAIGEPDLVRGKISSAAKGPLTLKEFIIFMGSGEHESLLDAQAEDEALDDGPLDTEPEENEEHPAGCGCGECYTPGDGSQTNEWGCLPSEDVCLAHDEPLVDDQRCSEGQKKVLGEENSE